MSADRNGLTPEDILKTAEGIHRHQGHPGLIPPNGHLNRCESDSRCTFPSCRCEWSKRDEHCPRYGGTTKGYS